MAKKCKFIFKDGDHAEIMDSYMNFYELCLRKRSLCDSDDTRRKWDKVVNKLDKMFDILVQTGITDIDWIYDEES